MTSHTRPAFAKINLTLDVLERRPDGYHEIRSIMQTIALHDLVTVTRTPDVPGVRLEVTGSEAVGVPCDESNLVHRAAVRLQKTAAARGVILGNQSGLQIELVKNIPSQAGLGGGSSDAAATLCAINRVFGLALSQQRLSEIAQMLGADVSFFLTGGLALVEGLGERVTPLEPLTEHWPLVIVKPSAGVSTAWAYQLLDDHKERRPGTATSEWLSARIANTPLPFSNDFHPPILEAVPEVAAAARALSENVGPSTFPPLLSGSGAALFRRMGTWEEAQALAAKLSNTGIGQVWVTQTVTGEHGE